MNILGDVARVIGGIVALVLVLMLVNFLASIGLNMFLAGVLGIAFVIFAAVVFLKA